MSARSILAALISVAPVAPASAQRMMPRLSGSKPLSQSNACRAYAEGGAKHFADRLAGETKLVPVPVAK